MHYFCLFYSYIVATKTFVIIKVTPTFKLQCYWIVLLLRKESKIN